MEHRPRRPAGLARGPRRPLRATRATLEAAGVEVVDVEIDTEGLDETWQTIELFGWFSLLAPTRSSTRTRTAATRAERHRGLRYSSGQIVAAMDRRYRAYTEMAALLEDFDAFVVPGAPVVAPDAEDEWVTEVDGVPFDRYFLWQRMAVASCRRRTRCSRCRWLRPGVRPAGRHPGGRAVRRRRRVARARDRLERVLGVSDVHPELG